MRIVILSDHAETTLTKRAVQRERDYERKLAAYNEERRQWKEKNLLIMEHMADQFRHGLLWGAAKHLWRLLKRLANPGPAEPAKQLPDETDAIWAAGKEGQDMLITYLKERLDDTWTLYCGYCNGRGEIDALLVGPDGFFAMEIKHINGIISCDGGNWWRDRKDSSGCIIAEHVPISDRTGRSPSRQLTEPAEVLDRYIAGHIEGYPSRKMVIITHPSAELGSFESLEINSIKLLEDWDVPEAFEHLRTPIPMLELELINELILKSHQYHKMRRSIRSQKTDGQRHILQKTSGGLI